MDERDVQFVRNLQAQHLRYASQQGGLNSALISDYHFHTENPDERRVPVGVEHLHPNWQSPQHDCMHSVVQSWAHELTDDGYDRMHQKLTQLQSDAVTNRRRGIGTTFTRELAHPLDPGAETHLLNYSYMPSHPTKRQMARAREMAAELGAFVDYHRIGEEYFWKAPGQSFRHEARK